MFFNPSPSLVENPGENPVTNSSHNFAGNQRVFIKGIHGAEPVIAVGDDDLAVAGVAHQQNRRERLPGDLFSAKAAKKAANISGIQANKKARARARV